MSVIVAIKGKVGIVVGADKQATFGHTKVDNITKITMTDYGNSIIGCVGYARDGDLLSIQDNLMNLKDIITKTMIDFKYVVNNIVPNLFSLFRNNYRIKNEDGIETINSQILYCTNNKLFAIYADGCVIETEKYAALGCGNDLVMGYLHTLKDLHKKSNKELRDIIETAIKQCCKDDVYINDRIDFLELPNKQTILG